MPYVKRTVIAGPTIEIKKCFTGRVHTKGATRSGRVGKTKEAQAKVNDRKAEEELRWLINANFGEGDFHIVLHYADKSRGLEDAEADRKKFLRGLRKIVTEAGLPWRYIAVTETKRMTNIHHHILMPPVPVGQAAALWQRITGGNISVRVLDNRQNHAKLANYLIKESRSTMQRWAERGKRYKRWTRARGMAAPVPKYEVIEARSWAKEPKPKKGYRIWKDENGSFLRTGWHELTGWPWAEYTEIRNE